MIDWHSRIREAFPAGQPDDDVVEELAQHAAASYAASRAEGCAAEEAERRANLQIDAWRANPALLRRRPARPAAVLPPPGRSHGAAAVAQDARYAWRLLRRQPAYTALVVLTMALGIAATTVIGSVAYGVLLKPLPWADAPRLVRLYETRQGSTRRFTPMITNATLLAWREAPSSTLETIEGWASRRAVMGGDGPSQQVPVAGVTPGLIAAVGGAPLIGRLFQATEAEDGRPRVAVISYGLWQQRFGGAADVLGRTLRFDGITYTIVGVMPASFAFPDRTIRAWLPFLVRPMVTPGSQGATLQMFQALGRMRPGVTPEQVAAEGTARGRSAPTMAAVVMAVFGSSGLVEVSAVPLLQALTGEIRPAILILLAAVGLLLVTATANAASLQLARAAGRKRELAIRAALGAGRARLVRQILAENVLLGLLGGVAGLALAALMHAALPTLLPADFPRLDDLAFDVRIQAFAVAIAVGAGLGCGCLPALHVARHDLVPALVEDSLAPVGGGLRSRTARARAAIMTAQVAIACVLLVGALLLVRSFSAMIDADVGYDATNLLTAQLILPNGEFTAERRVPVVEEVVARLGAARGVIRAAAATSIPFSGGEMLQSFPVKTRDGGTVQVQTGLRTITPGYFAALGQRIVDGREFTRDDGARGQRVVIVNQEFSRRYLEGRAVGWTLPGKDAAVPIIGVVENTARHNVGDPALPEVYYLIGQQGAYSSSEIQLIVRTAVDPRELVPVLRTVARDAAPAAPLESIMTMEDRVSESLARPRLYAVLLGTFAAFALAIAGVGLFGVLSYSVAQRAREIGVRSALGAQVRDIVALVFRQSLAIAGAGVAVGLLASLWLTAALQRFLYGVTAHDSVSFAAVAALLIAVAVVASIVPARRAAKVDPVSVLRR